MKKRRSIFVIAIIFIAAILSSCASTKEDLQVAFETNTFTGAQVDSCSQFDSHPRRDILREKFLKSRIEVTVGVKSPYLSKRIPSNINTQTWRYWSAYRGSEPIFEEAFFSLCGLENEAREARRHYESANRRVTFGKVSMWMGVIALSSGSFLAAITREYDLSFSVLIVGVAAAGASWYLTSTGYEDKFQCWASYAQAKKAANAYNAELCKSLLKQK